MDFAAVIKTRGSVRRPLCRPTHPRCGAGPDSRSRPARPIRLQLPAVAVYRGEGCRHPQPTGQTGPQPVLRGKGARGYRVLRQAIPAEPQLARRQSLPDRSGHRHRTSCAGRPQRGPRQLLDRRVPGSADQEMLGVPADHDIVMLLPVGYPVSADQFNATTERLALDQIVFIELQQDGRQVNHMDFRTWYNHLRKPSWTPMPPALSA